MKPMWNTTAETFVTVANKIIKLHQIDQYIKVCH